MAVARAARSKSSGGYKKGDADKQAMAEMKLLRPKKGKKISFSSANLTRSTKSRR